ATFVGKTLDLLDALPIGVLELKNLAFYVDGDLAREIATRHRGRHFGDVAHLCGEIARHRVHAVGQVFPGARHAGHVGLTAETALRADLARHAGDLAGEAVELVDHRVERLFEL